VVWNCLIANTINFAVEYVIRKVQETNSGLDMIGTHQVLAYADYVNFKFNRRWYSIIERNVEVLVNACKDIGLAVNTGKLSRGK